MNYLISLFINNKNKTLESALATLNKVLTDVQGVAQKASSDILVLEADLEKTRQTALQASLVAKNIQALLNK